MNALTEYFHGPEGRRIAYRHIPGNGPTLVFLPGYMSDMAGSKATALMDWARESGRECLLLDYSGGGGSDGAFADGTLSRWRDEVVALVTDRIEGDVILIGSSMGGWLMLLAGMELGDRLAGLVGIAPAPDFTEWGRSDTDKDKLAAGETVYDDDYNGIALSTEEGDRIAAKLGDKGIVFMAAHGVTVTGSSVARTFDRLYYLERACRVQVIARSTGLPLRRLSDDVIAATVRQFATSNTDTAPLHFDSLKRILDRDEPDYKN